MGDILQRMANEAFEHGTAMTISATEIIKHVKSPEYRPVTIRQLARQLRVPEEEYREFRKLVRALIKQGRLKRGKGDTIRPQDQKRFVVGVFRPARAGYGFVKPIPEEGVPWVEIFIPAPFVRDANRGDEVLVQITRFPSRPGKYPEGRIIDVVERATTQFVGTYFEQDGVGYVRIDGTTFGEPVYIGDPGVKKVQPDDKVVVDIVRFPQPGVEGEGVIVEVLGPKDDPDIDTLTVIREFELPDVFPKEALEQAREAARAYDPEKAEGRQDFTQFTTVTIDPVDAQDFDDAVHVHREEDGSWVLHVHIADVAHFVPEGTALDGEARKRGTSVYLPGRVIPMLPEVLSNGVCSLQEGKLRFTKSVVMRFNKKGTLLDVQISPGVIKVTKRLDYDTVMDFWQHPEKYEDKFAPEVRDMLQLMRELAALLRKRRRERGFLELELPEIKLDLDSEGRLLHARVLTQDESHQCIEEFMLSANEAVARYLDDRGVVFLRRIHPSPDEYKLEQFAAFVRALGFKVRNPQDRYELQRLLDRTRGTPLQRPIHYMLLRSMKQAVYSPEDEGHYGIASDAYCHFTSPIRRYPDLIIHRILDRIWKEPDWHPDVAELRVLGEHCTFTERRAESAERELVKLKILRFLSENVGVVMHGYIRSIEDIGFFVETVEVPVEGFVHVSALADDYYRYDRQARALVGARKGRTYRLGDRLTVKVVHVDLDRREVDLQLTDEEPTIQQILPAAASSVAVGAGDGKADPGNSDSEPRRRRKRTAQARRAGKAAARTRNTPAKKKRRGSKKKRKKK